MYLLPVLHFPLCIRSFVHSSVRDILSLSHTPFPLVKSRYQREHLWNLTEMHFYQENIGQESVRRRRRTTPLPPLLTANDDEHGASSWELRLPARPSRLNCYHRGALPARIVDCTASFIFKRKKEGRKRLSTQWTDLEDFRERVSISTATSSYNLINVANSLLRASYHRDLLHAGSCARKRVSREKHEKWQYDIVQMKSERNILYLARKINYI